MPLNIISPPHSFVKFDGDLSDVVLPAYGGIDVAFQFLFPAEAMIALTTPVKAGVAYTSNAVMDATFDAVNVCAWGRFEEIDFEKDFPLTVSGFPLAGTYATPADFLLRVRQAYGVDATGQTFLQCCGLDGLPEILFTYNGSKVAGINFYKGLQQVTIEAGFDRVPLQVGQCFKYLVAVGTDTAVSNVFERVDDNSYLTRVKYSGNEDTYGFYYHPITKNDEVPAKPPTGQQGIVAGVRASSWNSNGARIYAPHFPLNGLGTVVSHLVTPHFWVNGDTAIEVVNGSPTGNNADGRMNENGIWVAGNIAPGTVWLPVDEWIGFSRRITLDTAKRMYVGISGDNCVRLKINGTEILNTTGSNVFQPSTGINFLTWSIYPVDFLGGDNFLEMSVMNTSVNFSSNPAGFACEIYDMSLTQLQGAQSEADLVTVFRTRDMVGQGFDIGTSIGYSCEDGWILEKKADGTYACVKTSEAGTMYNENYLPIIVKKPTYPEDRKVYKKSNNQYKVLSVVIEKEWECKTEDLPDSMHEKIAVMLAHDNVHFTNLKIDADIFKTGEYTPEWADDDWAETAIAKFKVNTVFAGRNSNCEKPKICAPLVQPVECVPVATDPAFVLPDATINQPYNVSQPITAGTLPYTLTPITKPDWMQIVLQGSNIVYSGTPTSAGTSETVQFNLSNCGAVLNIYTGMNVGGSTATLGQTIDVGGFVSQFTNHVEATINNPLPDDVEFSIIANVTFGTTTQALSFTVPITAGSRTGTSTNVGSGVIQCVTPYTAQLNKNNNTYNVTLTVNGVSC